MFTFNWNNDWAGIISRGTSRFLKFLALNGSNTVLSKGSGVGTYTRASGTYVPDFEGRLVYTQPNCPSFPGLRSVSNLLTYSEDFSNAIWTKTTMTVAGSISDPIGGVSAWRLTATGASSTIQQVFANAAGSKTNQIWIRRNSGVGTVQLLKADWSTWQTVTIDTNWKRISLNITGIAFAAVGVLIGTSGDSVDVWQPQVENLTGAANQNPSEYVPTTSAPITVWKDYLNPYTVDGNGVITDSGVRTPISTGKGLLSEPAGTNLINNSIVPATQSVTVTAQQYTLSCMGIGSVTLSGTAAGSITGVSTTDIKTLTFTPTAGTLTLTLTGSLTALQVETGSVNTSFMLSSGATSTRAATLDSYPTAGNLSGTVGTVYLEATFNSMAQYNTLLGVGAAIRMIGYFAANLNTLYAEDGTTTRVLATGIGGAVGTKLKIVIAFNGTNIRTSINGGAVQTSVWDGDWNLLANFCVGSNQDGSYVINGYIGAVKIFNTALTDAQLVAMTL